MTMLSGCVDAEGTTFDKALAETNLKDAFGGQVEVKSIAGVADDQLAEVTLGDGSIVYMTPNLKHIFYRDALYQLEGKSVVNLTEQAQNPRRAEALKKVADKDTVIFPAKGEEKAVVNVFTDIDCGYCQLLHNEVEDINELGITVRYLAYPRSGIVDPQSGQFTASYQKINYVWCQDDRQTAMTEMKTDQSEMNQAARKANAGDASAREEYTELQTRMVANMRSASDCEAPIEAQYVLGGELGVRGTPAIFTSEGKMFPGYLLVRVNLDDDAWY
ncbi:MAG: thioredoxin fold domain-containing protein, partial [Oceanobacter sp.]